MFIVQLYLSTRLNPFKEIVVSLFLSKTVSCYHLYGSNSCIVQTTIAIITLFMRLAYVDCMIIVEIN